MRALLLAIAVAAPAVASAGIFDAAEPNVSAGNEALSKGDAAAALGHYERAIEAHPDAGEVWYDKGLALDALGRHEEAAEAFTQALARRRDGSLGAKDYTNLGNAQAAANRVDEAMRSYRAALEIDPDDEVARQNLEVMLRRKQQESSKSQPKDGQDKDPSQQQKDSPQQAGSDDQQQKDSPQQAGNDDPQQKDSSQQAGNEDRQQKDSPQQEQAGGRDAQQKPDEGKGAGEQEARQDGQQESQPHAGASEGEKGDRQDAAAAAADGKEPPDGEGRAMPSRRTEIQRILDSLRGNEKSFQLWRGQEKGRRSDAEKDW